AARASATSVRGCWSRRKRSRGPRPSVWMMQMPALGDANAKLSAAPRSAAAKALDEQAVLLAVAAHVRHALSGYDALLAAGNERYEARREVKPRVDELLAGWRDPK